MATDTSSIDDLLMSGKTQSQPEAPEHQYEDNLEPDAPEVQYEDQQEVNSEKNSQDDQNSYESDLDEPQGEERESPESPEYDEYGNPKAKPRVYTEEEVNDRINKAIRDRLSRLKSQEQALPTVQQVQQAQQNFEYNPNAEGNWQQQLESFVEQTFNKISQRQVTQAQQQKEAAAHNEFQEKFVNGMDRFSDFRDVVGAQPITDPMTLALRGMKDPAAFVYAASKRHPAELQRISSLPDPYAQMVEMGKLEERMRKTTQGTKAPRPLARTKEDTGMPQAKKKQEGDSIEDLIAKADTKRRAQLTARRGRG
jgi:hypothetical protein